jgi:hypothetical protein
MVFQIKEATSVNKKYENPNLSLFDVPVDELARQFCIFESELFREIKYSEFRELGWGKANSLVISPNIKRSITRFNKVKKCVNFIIHFIRFALGWWTKFFFTVKCHNELPC